MERLKVRLTGTPSVRRVDPPLAPRELGQPAE
jgi:hypothetical protein